MQRRRGEVEYMIDDAERTQLLTRSGIDFLPGNRSLFGDGRLRRNYVKLDNE